MHALLLPLMFATAAATAAEQPAWLASTVYDDYGRHERVLKPWAPLTYGPREVSAWGRTLRWCPPSLLPSQIESQGKVPGMGPGITAGIVLPRDETGGEGFN